MKNYAIFNEVKKGRLRKMLNSGSLYQSQIVFAIIFSLSILTDTNVAMFGC